MRKPPNVLCVNCKIWIISSTFQAVLFWFCEKGNNKRLCCLYKCLAILSRWSIYHGFSWALSLPRSWGSFFGNKTQFWIILHYLEREECLCGWALLYDITSFRNVLDFDTAPFPVKASFTSDFHVAKFSFSRTRLVTKHQLFWFHWKTFFAAAGAQVPFRSVMSCFHIAT